MSKKRMRLPLAIVTATIASLGAAQAAQAASTLEVKVVDGEVVVRDTGTDANYLKIERVERNGDHKIRVEEGTGWPSAGAGCRPESIDAAICDAAWTVRVDGGAEDDLIQVDPALHGEIQGGGGADLLVVGHGTWPSGMTAHAAKMADLAEDVAGLRWPAEVTAPPASPANVAAAWQGALDQRALIGPPEGADTGGPRAPATVFDGGPGDDVLLGDEGANQMTGGAGRNVLVGAGGDDILFATTDSGGTDVFVPGTGADRLDGNTGAWSVADYFQRTGDISGSLETAVLDDGDGQPDTVSTRGFLGGTGRNLVTGSQFSDLLYGSDARDRLDGSHGQDLIVGGPLDDGSSVTAGGAGDELIGGDGMDAFVTGLTNDEIIGGPTSVLTDNHADVVAYPGRLRPVSIDLTWRRAGSAGERDTLAGIDAGVGGIGPDRLRDSELMGDLNETLVRTNNMLDGGPGNDRLFGGFSHNGADEFFGGAGNDTIDSTMDFDYGTEGDRVHCGAGTDHAVNDEHDDVDADCETIDQP